MPELVLCDFDGTISRIDTGLAAAQAFQLEEFDRVEMAWRRGEISAPECLRRQWGLLDLQVHDLWGFVERMELDPAFADLAALAAARGTPLWVLSDGLDLYVSRSLERLGHAGVSYRANRCRLVGSRVCLEFPHRYAACGRCGNCKTRWLFDLRQAVQAERVVYIGDGVSDLCAAKYADVVFAKEGLARACAERGQPFRRFRSLADVVAAWAEGHRRLT